MGIHDDVRTDAKVAEWHIFLVDNETNDTFLTVATAEFVTNLWPSRLSHEHFDQEGIIVIARDHDLLDIGLDRVTVP